MKKRIICLSLVAVFITSLTIGCQKKEPVAEVNNNVKTTVNTSMEESASDTDTSDNSDTTENSTTVQESVSDEQNESVTTLPNSSPIEDTTVNGQGTATENQTTSTEKSTTTKKSQQTTTEAQTTTKKSEKVTTTTEKQTTSKKEEQTTTKKVQQTTTERQTTSKKEEQTTTKKPEKVTTTTEKQTTSKKEEQTTTEKKTTTTTAKPVVNNKDTFGTEEYYNYRYDLIKKEYDKIGIKSGDTERERYLKIQQYIGRTYYYNIDDTNDGKYWINEEDTTIERYCVVASIAERMIEDNEGVCTGFAAVNYFFLKMAGFEVSYVDNLSMCHAYCQVKLDGIWFISNYGMLNSEEAEYAFNSDVELLGWSSDGLHTCDKGMWDIDPSYWGASGFDPVMR